MIGPRQSAGQGHQVEVAIDGLIPRSHRQAGQVLFWPCGLLLVEQGEQLGKGHHAIVFKQFRQHLLQVVKGGLVRMGNGDGPALFLGLALPAPDLDGHGFRLRVVVEENIALQGRHAAQQGLQVGLAVPGGPAVEEVVVGSSARLLADCIGMCNSSSRCMRAPRRAMRSS